MINAVIVIVCGLLIVFISSLGWLLYNIRKDAPKRTMEELKTCFTQNKVKFEDAATVIGKYPGIVSVRKRAFVAKNDKMFYFQTNEKIYIESKIKLDNESIQEIGNNISYILNTLKFEEVSVEDGDFYFIEGSDLGTISGIAYVSTGDRPGDMYITKLERITDKWFIYKAR